MYDKKGDYSKIIEFYTKYLNLETDQIDIAKRKKIIVKSS